MRDTLQATVFFADIIDPFCKQSRVLLSIDEGSVDMRHTRPAFRQLRVFAFDPSIANVYSNRRVREVTISMPWELENNDWNEPFLGPKGEYVDVVDYDPASAVFYKPINLNKQEILLKNGVDPSEENPMFHQQMVYAVAMYTIHNFETALGRVALWSPREYCEKGEEKKEFVRRLRIYPHALREANAYYDPTKKALLFGYFQSSSHSKTLVPGTTVFTCLSQDVIAHETCHALLDGLHPRYIVSTNDDVLALHEAFADIVAIFQHFSFPETLKDQLAKIRGDLEHRNLLSSLAYEFGQALGRGGALRDALGKYDAEDQWDVKEPNATALDSAKSVHGRGAILVAAVFRAFINVYKDRTADLMRIATNGTGILKPGPLDDDLTNRLAVEASKTARHLLQMCIRALDYCPPVNVTFGDYLRAIVTADSDLFPNDSFGYRRAVIEGFRAWGILPQDMAIITEANLLWPTLDEIVEEQIEENNFEQKISIFSQQLKTIIESPANIYDLIDRLMEDRVFDRVEGKKLEKSLQKDARRIEQALLDQESSETIDESTESDIDERAIQKRILSRNLLELGLTANRKVEFLARGFYQRIFWAQIVFSLIPVKLIKFLGIDLNEELPRSVKRSKLTKRPSLSVESVRMANRLGDRGQMEREYVVELVQTRYGFLDPDKQRQFDSKKGPVTAASGAGACDKTPGDFEYTAGCTLLIDARTCRIRRVIKTPHTVGSEQGLARLRAHVLRRCSGIDIAFDPRQGLNSSDSIANLHRSAQQNSGL